MHASLSSTTGSPLDLNQKREYNGLPARTDIDNGAGPSGAEQPPPPSYEEALSAYTTSASGSQPSSSALGINDATPETTTTTTRSPTANPLDTNPYRTWAADLNPNAYVSTSQQAPVYLTPPQDSQPDTNPTYPRPTHDDREFQQAFTSRESSIHRGSGSSTFTSTSPHSTSSSAPPASNDSSPTQPPAAFTREPSTQVSYQPFPPASLYARGSDLTSPTSGFPLEPPRCACAPAPHPFITHDITLEDWTEFLTEVRGASEGLKPVNTLVAEAAPTAVMAGLLVGFLADQALRAHIKSKRKSRVAEVIDEWNMRFFNPRLMNVVLAQGLMAYSGPIDVAPADMATPTRRNCNDENDIYSNYGEPELGGRARRRRANERGIPDVGETRKAGKRGRVAFSRDLKASAGEKWRLVISYKAPAGA